MFLKTGTGLIPGHIHGSRGRDPKEEAASTISLWSWVSIRKRRSAQPFTGTSHQAYKTWPRGLGKYAGARPETRGRSGDPWETAWRCHDGNRRHVSVVS